MAAVTPQETRPCEVLHKWATFFALLCLLFSQALVPLLHEHIHEHRRRQHQKPIRIASVEGESQFIQSCSDYWSYGQDLPTNQAVSLASCTWFGICLLISRLR
jgi:hypothetical protein